MDKRTAKNQSNTAGAALWTPWGLQHRPERNAQKLAIQRLIKRLAALDKRRKLRPAG
ncbi:hypothetical protein [Mesorhizobium sp. DCY119]|jgi:hypothetical protein|uniref:hypothetical protein n=1 Tax=Mesorhizobium sp. DCY119 TaxID=2108445 RepID=UPI0013C52291|nr:hypothetical protein [Mesorhizobium sp. DCY119]